MKPCYLSALFAFCGLAAIASSAPASHELAEAYSFIDTTSGASAALLVEPPGLVMEEESQSVTFCKRDSGFHCFSTELVSFAVPRGKLNKTQWSYGGRIYCVVRSYPSTAGNLPIHEIHLIFSSTGDSCTSDSGFDTSAVYSSYNGLRLIRREFPHRRLVELYSLDSRGFGSRGR